MTQSVVVGVDGSPAAAAALASTVREAGLYCAGRDCAELVARTVEERSAADTVRARTPPPAFEELTGSYPVTARHGYGDAATELVAVCQDEDLLVVGSPGRGPLAGLVLGPVSRACLAQPCPVAVVRPQPEQAPSHERVVVGVDASSHARQALRLAAEKARLRGADLDVVHAVYRDNIGTELLTPTVEQLGELGRILVATELAATGVAGRTVVAHGHAAGLLVWRSAEADLLVLGSRGRNAVAGLLLGSTSEHGPARTLPGHGHPRRSSRGTGARRAGCGTPRSDVMCPS